MWVQSDLKCRTRWIFKWQQRSVCKVRHVTPQFADPQVLRKLEPGIGQELLPPHLLNNQMLLNNGLFVEQGTEEWQIIERVHCGARGGGGSGCNRGGGDFNS